MSLPSQERRFLKRSPPQCRSQCAASRTPSGARRRAPARREGGASSPTQRVLHLEPPKLEAPRRCRRHWVAAVGSAAEPPPPELQRCAGADTESLRVESERLLASLLLSGSSLPLAERSGASVSRAAARRAEYDARLLRVRRWGGRPGDLPFVVGSMQDSRSRCSCEPLELGCSRTAPTLGAPPSPGALWSGSCAGLCTDRPLARALDTGADNTLLSERRRRRGCSGVLGLLGWY